MILPHTSNPIVNDDLSAIYEMRAWMESVQDSLSLNPKTLSAGTMTADNRDFVSASSASTVFMPSAPFLGDNVAIRAADASGITVDGNGADIDGSPTITLSALGDSVDLYYFSPADGWFSK